MEIDLHAIKKVTSYISFIATYFYIGLTRNWSHEGQKLKPKAQSKKNPVRCGAPEANAFWT